jgi:hypothetical protein
MRFEVIAAINIKISLLGCDAVLFGRQVPKFHQFIVLFYIFMTVLQFVCATYWLHPEDDGERSLE